MKRTDKEEKNMATPKRQKYEGLPEYIRREDASYFFQIGDDTIDKLAEECGAKRKVRSMVLINRKIMSEYIESFQYVGKDSKTVGGYLR
jgi:hypothetical protein